MNYKTTFCPYFSAHGHCPSLTTCNYYHDAKDFRREPIQNSKLVYTNALCKAITAKAACQSTCPYAHNYFELQYHPFNRKDIFLTVFKTYPCILVEDHTQKSCMMFHSYMDKRRDFETYSCEKCLHYNSAHCPLGDKCCKAHNKYERFYHPQRYKTKYCNEHFYTKCLDDRICTFAHSDEDLVVVTLHTMPHNDEFYRFLFKTVWCPINKKHNKALCEYAHNWQDFRRRPDLFQYTNVDCPNWSKDGYIREYQNGCKDMAICKYCHGWKELQYHPLNYKVKICGPNHQSKHCPYYHLDQDSLCGQNVNRDKIVLMPPRKNPHGNVNDMMLERVIGNSEACLKYLVFDDETEAEKKYT